MNLTPEQRVKLVIAGGLVVAVVFVIILIFSIAGRIPEAKISSAFAKNIAFPKQIDDNTVYYFAGSAFASYDLTTYKTTPLTQFYTLPEIMNVKISKGGALVLASNPTVIDQLYETAVQQGLDTFGAYWWVFNLKTGGYSPVSKGNVQQITWVDDDTYIYSEIIGTTDTMRVLKADIGGQPTEVTTLSSTYELVDATDSTMTYLKQVGIEDHEPSELIRLDLTTQQTTTIAQDVMHVLASGDDGSMLFLIDTKKAVEQGEYTEEDDSGLLTLYSNDKKSSTKIEDRFTGVISWQSGANKWLALGRNDNGEPISIRNEGDKIVKFKTPIRAGLEYFPVARTDKGDVVANGYDEVFYATTSPIDNLPTTISYNNLPANGFEQAFSYAYDKTERQYNVYLQTSTNKPGVDAAVKYFQDQGVDPYQLYIKWYGVESDLTK